MPSHFVAWTEIARRHGFEFPEARFYSLGGVPTAKIAAMLIAEAGLTLDPAAVALEKEQMYYDSLAAGGGVRADRGRCSRLRAGTAPREPAGDRLGQRAAPGDAHARGARRSPTGSPAVVAAEDTARHKPEPDVFLEAARRLGVDPASLHRLRGHRHRPRSRPPRRHDPGRRPPAHPRSARRQRHPSATRLPPRSEERGDLRTQLVRLRGGRDGRHPPLRAQHHLAARQDVADRLRRARASPATISWNASFSTM